MRRAGPGPPGATLGVHSKIQSLQIIDYQLDWSGREDLNLRPPGPELRGAELILLIFNHLVGASTVSVLLDHPSLGVM
jgi:hypothetical protein